MLLTYETSRIKNIIMKKLIKSFKSNVNNTSEVGTSIENKVIATYTAKKKDNNEEKEKTKKHVIL